MSLPDARFLKKLLETFRAEAADHVSAITSGLVALENATRPEQRAEITESVFREAHSLKGASRAVNLGKLESICQSMESLLASLRNQQTTPTPELFDRLHHMVGAFTKELGGLGESRSALPAVEALPTAVTPKPISRSPSDEKPALPDTVRVSTARLEEILRETEELIPLKAVASYRATELREVSRALAGWEQDWRAVRAQIRLLPVHIESNRGNLTPQAGDSGLANSLLVGLFERSERVVRLAGVRASTLVGALENDHRMLDRRVSDLIEDVKRVSMLPFSTLLEMFPMVVRDLCRDCGKEAELVIEGGEIEVSRRILDEMKDPLIHLVRNSIDHGVEDPAQRERRGKPRRATIRISAKPKGSSRVEVSVSDDGAGIDTNKLIGAAQSQGLLAREEAAIDPARALDLIFHSGLSTSPTITDVSGRGLGLAIVREKIESLGGGATAETREGEGTTFRLDIPLTIATFRGVVVRTGQRLFAIPTMNVARVLRVDHSLIRTVENRHVTEFEKRPVAVVWLAEALALANPRREEPESRRWPGVLIEWTGERVLFLVDEILRDQELLVNDLGKQLRHVRNIAGAGVLESGRVIPVLNAGELLRSAATLTPGITPPAEEKKAKSILIAEDSITARTLLRSVFESSGYAVTTAVDGADAWQKVEQGSFDLVVSDVEMPRMSGLDLTQKIRANRRLSDLPIVLVTALDSPGDRERGAEAGANAYIVKSSFDQSTLLEVIQRLI
jgi:two-component system chemotaxis sensor kinase CheA